MYDSYFRHLIFCKPFCKSVYDFDTDCEVFCLRCFFDGIDDGDGRVADDLEFALEFGDFFGGGPGRDVRDGIFVRGHSKVGTDKAGNTFGAAFLDMAVFFLGRVIIEHGMRDLVECRLTGVPGIQSFFDADFVVRRAVAAVDVCREVVRETHGDRRRGDDLLKEGFIIPVFADEFVRQFRKVFTFGLADIKAIRGLETGIDFFFACVGSGLERHWGDDTDSFAVLFDDPVEVVFPCGKASNTGCLGHLHGNQNLIVQAVVWKTRHHGDELVVRIAVEECFDALFKHVKRFVEFFLSGSLCFRHTGSPFVHYFG